MWVEWRLSNLDTWNEAHYYSVETIEWLIREESQGSTWIEESTINQSRKYKELWWWIVVFLLDLPTYSIGRLHHQVSIDWE